MKTRFLLIILLTFSFSSFSQTENPEPLLGLPGDGLDLYAVLNLFQKSKTIEDFEKSLNEKKTGIVNLDLNNDGNVDFIKVVTEQDGDDFLFILQDPISENETQDVAVMIVSKDAAGNVSMQIIGDKELYGKDYVIEPRTEPRKSVTSNPAYTGSNPVTVNVQPTTEVIVVASAPIVQYVYSPVYVPYYPPYPYAVYPPYWAAAAVVSIGIYHHNNYHHHDNYHGGHGDVDIHRENNFNNYDRNNRNSSNTVRNNVENGNFKTSGQGGSRPSNSENGRASNRASTSDRASRASDRSSNRASTSDRANRGSTSDRSANRASTSDRASNRPSTSNRSTSPNSSNRSSASRSMGSSRSSYGGASRGGASRGGASRGGGSRGGGRRR